MIIVDFHGGVGVQILSYIYYLHKKKTNNVYADLSTYYKLIRKFSPVEDSSWKLEDFYGIKLTSIKQCPFPFVTRLLNFIESKFNYKNNFLSFGYHRVNNPIRMVELKEALQSINAESVFPIREQVLQIAQEIIEGDYIAVHVRRGSYINSNRYLVGYDSFLRALDNIKEDTNQVVVVSDSELDQAFYKQIEVSGRKVVKFIEGDVEVTHALMRRSKILIASNSTFSLTAGILSSTIENIYFPLQSFDGLDERAKSGILNLSDWIIIRGRCV